MGSVSKSIIVWLKQYNMAKIDTDVLASTNASYSLAKEPISNVKRYLSGKAEYTERYQISARLASATDKSRQNNVEWCEGLEQWIITQNKAGNFPSITDAKVSYIETTTPAYMGSTADGSAVYQLTISIKYTRR